MQDKRNGGIALIIGALSGIVTMALHPVSGGSHPITPAQFEKIASLMTGVHVLAIAGVPFLFLGALALAQHLENGGRLALTGLVIYSFGLVAVMIAPAISGLVGTEILRRVVAGGAAAEVWRTLLTYNFLLNQAFAKIFVVASSAGIAIWSWQIVKTRMLPSLLGIYGLLLAAAVAVALFSGVITLDAHGFGLVVFGQAIWLISTGVCLARAASLPARERSALQEN